MMLDQDPVNERAARDGTMETFSAALAERLIYRGRVDRVLPLVRDAIANPNRAETRLIQIQRILNGSE